MTKHHLASGGHDWARRRVEKVPLSVADHLCSYQGDGREHVYGTFVSFGIFSFAPLTMHKALGEGRQGASMGMQREVVYYSLTSGGYLAVDICGPCLGRMDRHSQESRGRDHA